jgi:CubicO group peptidase (beta-lactamase class C family)
MTPSRSRVIRWLALALLTGASTAIAQSDPAESDRRLIEALRVFIPEVMRQDGAPGLNLALARRGKVIWEEGFGLADVARKTPMTPATVMHSGSMGKTYTATAVMQLVERGVMNLHDPVNRYLAGFRVTNPLGEREITVYDLMTHRSGLAGNDAGSDFTPPRPLAEHIRDGYTRATFTSYGGTVPRWGAKVGERAIYSNFGLATLGYLVEVTNPDRLSFSDYVQKRIMDPLGMTSSQYPPVQDARHVRPEIFARMSTGYALMGNVRIPTPTIYFADYPAGTVVTTPGDHIKLLLAYLNDGSYNGYQLLRPETVRAMLTPQISRDTRHNGLIWMLRNHGNLNVNFEHGGAHMFGWHNDFRAYPELGFAVAVATNRWDMVLFSDPTWQTPMSLIADFIASWIERERSGTNRPVAPASWTWKTSYVIGLVMAEQLKGLLGTQAPVTAEMIETLARQGEEFAPGVGGQRTWDPAGFRAGMADLLAISPLTLPAIRTLLRSDRLRVLPEEVYLLMRELRGRSGFPNVGL